MSNIFDLNNTLFCFLCDKQIIMKIENWHLSSVFNFLFKTKIEWMNDEWQMLLLLSVLLEISSSVTYWLPTCSRRKYQVSSIYTCSQTCLIDCDFTQLCLLNVHVAFKMFLQHPYLLTLYPTHHSFVTALVLCPTHHITYLYIKFQTLPFMYQFETGKVPNNFDSFFIKTSSMHTVRSCFATHSFFYLPKH